MKRVISMLLAAILCCALLLSSALPAACAEEAQTGKLSPELAAYIEDKTDDALIPILLQLKAPSKEEILAEKGLFEPDEAATLAEVNAYTMAMRSALRETYSAVTHSFAEKYLDDSDTILYLGSYIPWIMLLAPKSQLAALAAAEELASEIGLMLDWDQPVEVLGHKWQPVPGEYIVCEGPIYVNYFCEHCGAWKTETVGQGPGHSFENGVCTRCGEKEPETAVFNDVNSRSWYYEAVYWAFYREPPIVKGMSEDSFQPNGPCTRGQVVTFLWRAAGCPAPTNTDNPFADVDAKKFYCSAVLWAAENGITKGVDKTHFAPDKPCTRGEIVTFLWRTAGCPAPQTEWAPFADVAPGAYYAQTVRWATERAITIGVSGDLGSGNALFAPQDVCTRAQTVTFLYRADIAEKIFPEPMNEGTEPGTPTEPPTYYIAHSVEDLITWIHTASPGTNDDWGSMGAFLRAAFRTNQLLIPEPTAEAYRLEFIMVRCNSELANYFYRCGEERFEIMIEYPGTEENPKPTLDEWAAQANAELSAEYPGLRYEKTSALVNGAETELWYCDGGDPENPDHGQTGRYVPTAVFNVDGYRVMLRVLGSNGEAWDNAYPSLFRFSARELDFGYTFD